MVREQFFAAPSQSEEDGRKERRTNLTKKGADSVGSPDDKKVAAGEKERVNGVQKTSSRKLREKSKSTESGVPSGTPVGETVVDGKLPSRTGGKHQNGLLKNGHILSERKESKDSEMQKPSPKGDKVGREFIEEHVSRRPSRVRHQTIASTEHTDIITNLLRNKERTSQDTEVLFPSVSELRAKFLAKDEPVPLRLKHTMDDRPRSICGETLSPTEMKEFDMQFSLERTISTEVIVASSKRDAAVTEQRVETELTEQVSVGLQPAEQKGGEIEAQFEETKTAGVAEEPSVEIGRRSASPESEPRKTRGSKKKRKRSLFGSDKDHGKSSKDTADEPGESSHSVKASGLKAMFGRRASITINRPKALAAGLKSELVRKATEMTQRRETYDERVRVEMQASRMADEMHAERPDVASEPSKDSAQQHRKDSGKEDQRLDVDDKKERKSLKKGERLRFWHGCCFKKCDPSVLP